jgi:hypothetical protein
MFYIDGKFGRNRMKIKEVEAGILVLLHAFLTGITAAFLNYVFHVELHHVHIGIPDDFSLYMHMLGQRVNEWLNKRWTFSLTL